MKIAIDITFLKDQYGGRGIGRYGQNVVSKLIKDSSHEWYLLGFGEERDNLKLLDTKRSENIIFYSLGKRNSSNYLNPLRFKFKFLPIIKKIKPDIFFAAHIERGLPIGKTKVAVAVHDIIPYVTNKYSNKGTLINYLKKKFYIRNLEQAKKADIVITDSEFSRNELVEKGGFDEEKIVVTPLSVSDNFLNYELPDEEKDIKRTLITYRITKPYIMYYGGLEPNKNAETLISAFEKISQRYPDLKLVIIGGEFKLGWDNKAHPLTKSAISFLDKVRRLKLEHKVQFAGRVDERHLPTILKCAEAFVHLSEYEGFGISVLEASAIGTPVIAANRSSYPEVLGDSAILVEPKDSKAIASAISKIIDKKDVAKEMSKKGKTRARQFSWEKTAELTLQAFEKSVPEEKKKVSVLIPFFHPQKGGAENTALAFSKRLVSDNYEVNVFTSLNKKLPAEEVYEGINIYRFKKLIAGNYSIFYPGMLGKFLRLKADYIHVHGFGFFWQDFCLIIKKLFSKNKPVIINSPYGPFMSLGNYGFLGNLIKVLGTFFMKFYLNWLYDFVTESNPTQVSWITKTYGIDPKKVKYLGNGIDKEMFLELKTKQVESKYKLNKKIVLSYIGRFNKYKGVDQVIKVLPELVKKYKDIIFLIIGRDVTEKKVYESLITENKLQKYVKIIDYPTDEIKDQLLQRSDIFILPSEWEAFGIVIVEAMAKGNAIISTKTEGGNFLIKKDENGYLFDFGDLETLKEKLIWLLKSKVRIEKIKKNNYKKAHEFLWDELYEKNYKSLLIKK